MNDKYGYEGSELFRPLSAWAYAGYSLLFCIPIVGQIFLIVYCFSDKNINRRNYARSYFCLLIIAVIILAVMSVTGLGYSGLRSLYRY